MASAAASALECPVCHEGFSEPKILPCVHLVCRKCVLSWLEKGGDQSGCPLCRAPILPESLKGQGDLASQVDALPTDLATAVVVESEKTLSGDHVCSCSGEASLFCLQCAIKLCSICAKTHAKIPTTEDHVTEKLSDLSAEELATHYQMPCVNHKGKRAELFCCSHAELICVLCASSTHRQCSEVKGVEGVAAAKREELRALLQRLADREAAVAAKMSHLDTQTLATQAEFKAMRVEVKAAFDDIQTSLDARRQKLNSEIQGREDVYLAERKSTKLDLENLHAALSANKNKAERLVASATDSCLLGMLGNLKSRLEGLESQVLPDDPKSTPSLLLSSVGKTKEAVSAVGVLKDSAKKEKINPDQKVSGRSPLEGPTFAAVIKVGDRVRRGRDWSQKYAEEDGSPPGVGIVTDIPAPGHPGWVRVRWHCGVINNYRMGDYNSYDLKFVFQ